MGILASALRVSFETHGARKAISFPEYQISYTYDEHASLAAQVIQALPDLDNQVLILYFDKTPSFFSILTGCFLQGISFCPIDKTSPLERVLKIAALFQNSIILTDLEASAFKEHRECLPREVKNIGFLVNIINVGTKVKAKAAKPGRYFIATSGSTGEPKLVSVPHDNVYDFCHWLGEFENVEDGTRWAQFSSIGFDLTIEDYVTVFLKGGELVVMSSSSQKLRPTNFIQKEAITNWNSVPSVIPNILNDPNAKSKIGSIKSFMFVGEPLYREQALLLADLAPKARIINKYCATETALYCSIHVVTEEDLNSRKFDSIPIGIQVPGCSLIYIDQPEGLRCFIASNNIAEGYFSIDDSAFGIATINNLSMRCFDTGDYFTQVDGRYIFSHRKDQMIKVRGNRIDKGEIINAVVISGVNESAVVLVNGRIHLFYDYESTIINERELFDALTKILPLYALPSKIHRVKNIPRTISGKIDSNQLATLAE